MPDISIPDDLVALVAERKVIPFVGAGFSAAHGLPTWEQLLRKTAAEVQAGAGAARSTLEYDEISRACNGDKLRIAEYLYLVAGGIGPLRQSISDALRTQEPLVCSTQHVELVNLAAPQVYTTNFDDLIERTYRELDCPVDVVARPNEMVRPSEERAQIVKYHGDLRYEETLVLTESQYYERLNLEAPMDVRFRSDLLGRSVLFVGYSFDDVNIRVIWFKLMQMMEEVASGDRPPSYIVRLRPNPVRDTLHEAVGLSTIAIDPDGEADSPAAQRELLSSFMLELSRKAAGRRDKQAAGGHPAFVSAGLLEAIEGELPDPRPSFRSHDLQQKPWENSLGDGTLAALVDDLWCRKLPLPLVERAKATFGRLARYVGASRDNTLLALALRLVNSHGGCQGATLIIANAFMVDPLLCPALQRDEGYQIDWRSVWGQQLEQEDLELLLRSAWSASRVDPRIGNIKDQTLPYAVDIAQRIARGQLVNGRGPQGEEIRQGARDLIEEIGPLYPGARTYVPAEAGAPDPARVGEMEW